MGTLHFDSHLTYRPVARRVRLGIYLRRRRQMKRPTRATRMLNAQARSVCGDAFGFEPRMVAAARLGDVTLVNPE
jgi:hypothetical protein